MLRKLTKEEVKLLRENPYKMFEKKEVKFIKIGDKK